jgi:hypothetical protein
MTRIFVILAQGSLERMETEIHTSALPIIEFVSQQDSEYLLKGPKWLLHILTLISDVITR